MFTACHSGSNPWSTVRQRSLDWVMPLAVATMCLAIIWTSSLTWIEPDFIPRQTRHTSQKPDIRLLVGDEAGSEMNSESHHDQTTAVK